MVQNLGPRRPGESDALFEYRISEALRYLIWEKIEDGSRRNREHVRTLRERITHMVEVTIERQKERERDNREAVWTPERGGTTLLRELVDPFTERGQTSRAPSLTRKEEARKRTPALASVIDARTTSDMGRDLKRTMERARMQMQGYNNL